MDRYNPYMSVFDDISYVTDAVGAKKKYMTYVFLYARTKWNKYDIEQFREDELEAKVFLYNELYRRLKILKGGVGGNFYTPAFPVQ